MIVWFGPGSSEYTEYTQMRGTNLNYKYDI